MAQAPYKPTKLVRLKLIEQLRASPVGALVDDIVSFKGDAATQILNHLGSDGSRSRFGARAALLFVGMRRDTPKTLSGHGSPLLIEVPVDFVGVVPAEPIGQYQDMVDRLDDLIDAVRWDAFWPDNISAEDYRGFIAAEKYQGGDDVNLGASLLGYGITYTITPRR